MIGIENKDSSFFTVESPDLSFDEANLSKNLISLTVTERISSMPEGSLSFYDPNHVLSRILRTGAKLKLSWGYKDTFDTPDSLLTKQYNLDEITGSLIRRGLQVFCYSPSGSGDAKGKVTFNCNFKAYGLMGLEEGKIIQNKTKSEIVRLAFDELGVSTVKRLIDFRQGNDKLAEYRQDETTFAFLVRIAKEWGQALFHISYDQKGDVVGIFIDQEKVDSTMYPTWSLDAIGKSFVIGYMGEVNNIKSYKWTSNEGENGVGDNIQLEIIDGNIVFRRYQAETKTVVTYRLNQNKIQNEFDVVSSEGLSAQVALFSDLMSKNDFDQIEHYFIPIEQETAPQGFGYRINCQMIGNPLYSPPAIMKINNGFPDEIGNTQSKWYLNSVAHTINKSGYNMNIEIVDAFILSPMGQVIL